MARLLAAGHTVHATTWSHAASTPSGKRRPSAVWPAATPEPAMNAVTKALNALPGASERLRWFAADLMVEGSFDAAMRGCK